MAQRNQFQTYRQGSPYGGRPGARRAEGPAGRGEPGMEHRAGQGPDDGARDQPDEMGTVNEMFARHPYTTTMTSFGIGFGLGLFLTLLLSRREESWFERYAPESMHDLPDRLKHAQEKAASYLPGSLKQARESLASYVPSSWKPW